MKWIPTCQSLGQSLINLLVNSGPVTSGLNLHSVAENAIVECRLPWLPPIEGCLIDPVTRVVLEFHSSRNSYTS